MTSDALSKTVNALWPRLRKQRNEGLLIVLVTFTACVGLGLVFLSSWESLARVIGLISIVALPVSVIWGVQRVRKAMQPISREVLHVSGLKETSTEPQTERFVRDGLIFPTLGITWLDHISGQIGPFDLSRQEFRCVKHIRRNFFDLLRSTSRHKAVVLEGYVVTITGQFDAAPMTLVAQSGGDPTKLITDQLRKHPDKAMREMTQHSLPNAGGVDVFGIGDAAKALALFEKLEKQLPDTDHLIALHVNNDLYAATIGAKHRRGKFGGLIMNHYSFTQGIDRELNSLNRVFEIASVLLSDGAPTTPDVS